MKILLAEDTIELNHLFTTALKLQNYDVDRAYDGEQALTFLTKNSYDAIVLDIMIPKRNGLGVLTELRSRQIMTPVMLLTAKAEIADRVAGLDSGADDYLYKPFSMKEFLARVRSMVRRHGTYEDVPLYFADITLEPESLRLYAHNSVVLSIREFELMRMLIANPDMDLTTAFLLGSVWHHDPEANEETVWLYILYLRNKLSSIGSLISITGKKGGSFRLYMKNPEDSV